MLTNEIMIWVNVYVRINVLYILFKCIDEQLLNKMYKKSQFLKGIPIIYTFVKYIQGQHIVLLLNYVSLGWN